MNKTLFESLIRKYEGRIIDFKNISYDFLTNKELEDAKFIKDLLSFSNTIRNESSFIIAGINEGNGTLELNGISNFTDDSTFQQKAMDKVWPKPVFSTYKFTYNNKVFGIIEFPVQHYSRPLVSLKPLKGVEVDRVYIRRGSSNSPASASELLSIVDWLQSLALSTTEKALIQSDYEFLMGAFSDTSTLLSATMSRLLSFSKKIGNPKIQEFCINELTGYKGKRKDSPDTFRLVKVPATPYEISILDQIWNADQMADKMLEMEKFWEIKFFFNYSILELEEMIKNLAIKDSLISLQFPYQQIFPELKSTVPNATIFISPRMLRSIYTAIRNYAISMLVNLELS